MNSVDSLVYAGIRRVSRGAEQDAIREAHGHHLRRNRSSLGTMGRKLPALHSPTSEAFLLLRTQLGTVG